MGHPTDNNRAFLTLSQGNPFLEDLPHKMLVFCSHMGGISTSICTWHTLPKAIRCPKTDLGRNIQSNQHPNGASHDQPGTGHNGRLQKLGIRSPGFQDPEPRIRPPWSQNGPSNGQQPCFSDLESRNQFLKDLPHKMLVFWSHM